MATPLGVSVLEAAWGTYAVAAANMTRAVKAVSTYRGRDPRDFALLAFGGNGPIAAVEIARALGMSRVIVPPAPGVFSAFGLLFSDIEYVVGRTLFRRMAEVDGGEIAAVLQIAGSPGAGQPGGRWRRAGACDDTAASPSCGTADRRSSLLSRSRLARRISPQ